MKLYATTTSERASKGQGGNRHLLIELFAGSTAHSRLVGTVRMTVEGARYRLSVDTENYGEGALEEEGDLIKGEKQKGKKICSEIGCLEPQSDRGGGLCNYHDKSL